jgi:hypothetical protein
MRRTAIGTAAGVALLVLGGTGVAWAQDAPKDAPKDAAATPAVVEEKTPVVAAQPADKPAGPLGLFKLPGSASLTVSGHVMVRGDYRKHNSYAAAADPKVDASAFVERLRLSFDLEVNEHLRAKAVIQDGRTWGTEGTLNGTTTGGKEATDLYEGYLEGRKLFGMPWTVRAGRMMVPRLGDQRLFSDLIWSNFPRSWDGVHSIYGETSKLHAIATIFTEVGAASTAADADDDFWNFLLYWQYRAIENLEVDVYFNARVDDTLTYASETGVGPPDNRRDVTLGGRYKWKGLDGAFWTSGEIAVQGGRIGGDDILAWGGAIKADYTLSKAEKGALNLAADFEYAYASGDTRPTDGKINTFDPLLPFQHFYHGHADQIRWSNVHAVKLGTRWNLGVLGSSFEGFTFHTDFHAFWLASRRDAWYSAGGAAVRRDATRTVAGSGAIGSEVDVYVKGTLWKNLGIWAGYSHFFPGVFVHDTAPQNDRDQDWVFLMLTLQF